MIVAALDLGTNSFLCLIADIEKKDNQILIKKIISDQVEVVRLGQSVQQNKKFIPEALTRAQNCFTNFKKSIDLYKPEKILAMATSAARDVSNADELFKLGESFRIPIEIIPGNKEAEMTFFGSISGLGNISQKNVVIDVGGGSTEIIIGDSEKIYFSKSADIGAVRITEMFFSKQPPTSEEFKKAQKYIQEQLQFLRGPVEQYSVKQVIGVAGTPTELAKIVIGSFDREKIDGFQISLNDLEIWQEKFLRTTSTERENIYKVSSGRADIILAGTMILKETLEILGQQEMIVSTRGVRYGVALEMGHRFL